MKLQCVFIIDKNGHRVASVIDNFQSKEKLMARAQEVSCDGTHQFIYTEDGQDMLDAFLRGKIYKNGKMVDSPVIEPSAVEIKIQKIKEITVRYNEKFAAYDGSLLRARLAGNEAGIKQLQAQYKKDRAAMAREIKEA